MAKTEISGPSDKPGPKPDPQLEAVQKRLTDAIQIVAISRNWFSLLRLTLEGLRVSKADNLPVNATALLTQAAELERWATDQERRLSQPIDDKETVH